ncbi:DegT/DnrJ/EryC1/StrS family aminotransferase [Patescibacteria group bacterium]|nr:DegT/DnrJ/EryC1/StrS family aminotransferase [Patescibacteria group bacterium]
MKYPIAKPYITKKEEKYALEVLRSGILSIGPYVKEFEKKFAKFIGTKYACAVSSGTSGLHLAMIAAGIKPGDEVITSPFSFIASSNSILYVGAKPVFVDIDEKTFNIDVSKIEKKITKKTKAILVVHIFGQSADMDPILKLAKKYKLKIIEDACESIGAKYKNKKVGTFGESAVFAFYPNKQMTTGEGGIITTNSKKVYDLCCSLRNQGRAQNMQWLDHQRLGFNYRMDEMSAAVGLAQIEKINFLIKERQKLASLYNKALVYYDDIVQIPGNGNGRNHTYFVYVIKLKNSRIKRNSVVKNMQKKGISTKAYLPSIHLFSFYKKMFKYKKGDFPISESVSKNSLALPFYIGLKKKDIEIICQELIKLWRI